METACCAACLCSNVQGQWRGLHFCADQEFVLLMPDVAKGNKPVSPWKWRREEKLKGILLLHESWNTNQDKHYLM